MANVKKNNYNNRKYLPFDDPLRLKPRPTTLSKKQEDVTKLVRYIDDNIIGKNNAFYGPFGRRKGKLLCKNNYLFLLAICYYKDVFPLFKFYLLT